MTLDEYQNDCLGAAVYPTSQRVVYPAIGLAGEAGEICNKLKKVMRGDHKPITEVAAGTPMAEDLADELGDVLCYAAYLAHDLGYKLSDVAELNITKRAMRRKMTGSRMAPESSTRPG